MKKGSGVYRLVERRERTTLLCLDLYGMRIRAEYHFQTRAFTFLAPLLLETVSFFMERV